MQHFVGLLIGWNRVVGRGEAGGGRDEEESGEGGCCNRKLLFTQNTSTHALLESDQAPLQLSLMTHPTPKTNTTSYIPAKGFRIRILNSSSVL